MATAAAARHAGEVRQIVVLCGMPARLRHHATHAWLLEALTSVAAAHEVCDVRLASLESTREIPRSWPWMATLELEEGADPDKLLRRGPIADLIGDMRLIGMHPEVLVVPAESERVTP